MRIPNIITSISDVLAGIAIAGSLISVTFGLQEHASLGKLMIEQFNPNTMKLIGLLILSTIGLYGGGVVLNDVFDAKLDKIERPERPIPSGLISKKSAAIFGIILLIIGVVAAALSETIGLQFSNIRLFSLFSSQAAKIALGIAIGAVIYDKWTKHSKFLGPLNMGACRGLNLLLGMSITGYGIQHFWQLAFVPIIYIAAVTMISRGEVHGGKRKTLYFAAILYAIVLTTILVISYQNHTLTKSLPLALMFSLFIFPSLQSAISKPDGERIGKAVKSGVLGLILMNATWAAAFNDLVFSSIIILLLPISYFLSRAFAVT